MVDDDSHQRRPWPDEIANRCKAAQRSILAESVELTDALAQEGAPEYIVRMIHGNMTSQARLVRIVDELIQEVERNESTIIDMMRQRRDSEAREREYAEHLNVRWHDLVITRGRLAAIEAAHRRANQTRDDVNEVSTSMGGS